MAVSAVGGGCERLEWLGAADAADCLRDLRLPILVCDQDPVRGCLSVAENVFFFIIVLGKRKGRRATKILQILFFFRRIIKLAHIFIYAHLFIDVNPHIHILYP